MHFRLMLQDTMVMRQKKIRQQMVKKSLQTGHISCVPRVAALQLPNLHWDRGCLTCPSPSRDSRLARRAGAARINLWLSWLGGQWYFQPTRVQILVLALFLDLFQDFRRCAFSGRRRFRRRRGAYGDFINLKMICRLSLSEVLIGIGCTCVRL